MFEDLTGKKFNHLTVVERAENDKYGCACWLCLCDCTRTVIVQTSKLKSGHTKSCGKCINVRARSGNQYEFFEDYCVGKDKKGNEFIIDKEDYPLISQYTWAMQPTGHFRGCIAGRSRVLLHVFLMNPPDAMVVDHINRNPADNRKANLRICTQKQNCRNQGLSKHNTSGLKGVSWYKKTSKWRAYIEVDGKRISLGLYFTKKEAADAYDKAALEYYGEFAWLNNYQGTD